MDTVMFPGPDPASPLFQVLVPNKHSASPNSISVSTSRGFPCSSVGKGSACNAGDPGEDSIPGGEDPLEKEMATHSSILAWKIPWTEEPGGLQFMGSQELDTT